MPTAVLIASCDEIWLYGDDQRLRDVAVDHYGHWHDQRECWVVPAEQLRAVTDRLDQLGFAWATEWQGAPRQWAQWLFSELPAAVHDQVYQALVAVLDGQADCRLHLRLLESAWEQHRGR